MARAVRRSTPPIFSAPAVLRLFLRGLRIDRWLASLIFVVVLVAATVFAAVPRLYNHMSDDGLRHAMQLATPVQGNVELIQHRPFSFGGTSDDPLSAVKEQGAALEHELPPALSATFARRTFVVDSSEYLVGMQYPLPFPLFVSLRYQSDLEDQISLTDGRLPAATDETVKVEVTRFDGTRGPAAAPVIEIATSGETASQAGLKIGDRLVSNVTQDRRFQFEGSPGSGYVVLEVVGRFDIVDAGASYWYGDVNLQRPTLTGSVDAQQVHATALIAPQAYSTLVDELTGVFDYRWRYFVDASRVDAGQLDALSAAVRRAKSEHASFLGPQDDATALHTGLDEVFGGFVAQRHLTEAILAVVTMGLLAVAGVVIGLIGALLADRRRRALVLQRGRGASAWQLMSGQLVEGLLLTVPAAAIGLAIALAIVSARPSSWSPLAAALATVVATLLLAGAMLPVSRRSLGQLDGEQRAVDRTSPRRLVFESVVVVLAVLGIYLLRRRGLVGGAPGAPGALSSGFDPFLAAAPVLLGLAVGLVVLRLYPLPVRLVGFLASLGRGFVPVFALRRVGRQPGAVNLPLLVLLLTVAVGVFSSVLLSTIERGQLATAAQQVGAAYRADAAAFSELPATLDFGKVPGVEAAARAYLLPGVTFDMKDVTSGPLTLDAVETHALAQVTRGTLADPHLPLALLSEPEQGKLLGTPKTPIPALVSPNAPVGNHAMAVGEHFQLLIEGAWTDFEVTEVRDHVPGIEPGLPFVMASWDQLQAARPSRPLRVTTVLLRGPASAQPAIAAALKDASALARLESQDAAYRALHEAPLISGVASGFRIGLLVAIAFSALAVIVALTLTAASRARDLAFLRTLGLSAPQSIGLTVVEYVPPLVLALVAGTALGIGVTYLIAPGLDLQAFAGRTIPVVLLVDWLAVGLLGLGIAILVALAVLLTTWVARRANLGRALRVGDE